VRAEDGKGERMGRQGGWEGREDGKLDRNLWGLKKASLVSAKHSLWSVMA
jgi:hypothetical protein